MFEDSSKYAGWFLQIYVGDYYRTFEVEFVKKFEKSPRYTIFLPLTRSYLKRIPVQIRELFELVYAHWKLKYAEDCAPGEDFRRDVRDFELMVHYESIKFKGDTD